jgi:hypothetical protein
VNAAWKTRQIQADACACTAALRRVAGTVAVVAATHWAAERSRMGIAPGRRDFVSAAVAAPRWSAPFRGQFPRESR